MFNLNQTVNSMSLFYKLIQNIVVPACMCILSFATAHMYKINIFQIKKHYYNFHENAQYMF